ncbi:Probable prolyl 4-hydroxylase 11 [Striga hermonthica]|uniref:Probable prolyl 4-hydroxylase 11 n=1 Tax=Striga hermonthica TaxID=68872 RepID=A0A9N7MBT1_STRHE|nr:Probable prolyl 4-hydroxylase 11 [Striga hermonthica]
MSKTLTTKLYLKQRLYGLKMQEGTDLGQHVNIFNQVVTDLASLEVKIEDEDKAMILLCSLPPSYEHMVTTLTYGKETIKNEEITSALLAHNQRKQKSGESSSQSDSLYVKGNQDRGRKQVRDNSGNRNFRSKSRDKSKGRKTVTCYKCKEQGHFKRDCPKWKKQTVDMSSKSANVVQNEESNCSDGDMLSISTTKYDDAWILDSGCSYHITPNREGFATYKPGNSGSVFLGDDRCCGIVGIGDVKIRINGFIPKADEDRETIKIVKGALTVMKGRITAGNIYKLLGKYSCVKGYKFWDPVEKKTVISRDAVFYEQSMLGSDAYKVQVELEHVPAVLDKGESSSSAPDDVDHDVSGPTDVPESYKLARDRVRRTNIQAPEFEMKDLGAAKKILGMEIHRDRGSKKLWLSQKGYVEKVLQRFGMNEAKPVSTPLANHFKLSADQCPKSDKETHDMVEIPYASVVGCLMYAMVCTRPDLAHAVGQVCKYMSRPGENLVEPLESRSVHKRNKYGWSRRGVHGRICDRSENFDLVGR